MPTTWAYHDPMQPSAGVPFQGRSVVINGAYLTRNPFGIHRAVLAIARFLDRVGADVTVVTDGPPRSEIPEGIRIVILPQSGPLGALSWEQSTLWRYLRTCNAEVFLAPGNRGLPVLPVPMRTVLMIHDLIPMRFWSQYSRSIGIGYLPLVASVASSAWRADAVVVPSLSTAKDVHHYLRRDTVLAFPPMADLGIELADVQSPGPYFAFTGGSDRRKHLRDAIRGFGRFAAGHPGHQLVVTGDIDPTAYRDVLDEVAERNVIRFTGNLSQEELNQLVARATAVIYPSDWEGRGLPILEALALGVPVICGTGGSQPEMAGAAGTYLDPITPETIAASLADLADRRTTVGPSDQNDQATIAQAQFTYVDHPSWSRSLLEALWPEPDRHRG